MNILMVFFSPQRDIIYSYPICDMKLRNSDVIILFLDLYNLLLNYIISKQKFLKHYLTQQDVPILRVHFYVF